MTPIKADIPPFLIAEDPALDLLNSVCAPWGDEIEWLADGQALLAWLEQAQLVAAGSGQKLAAQHGAGSIDVVAGEARDLREQFRSIVGLCAGAVVGREQFALCQPINRLLVNDDQRVQAGLSAEGRLTLNWQRNWCSPDQLLMPLAQAMLELLASTRWLRVKQCQGHGCTLWYVDNSKNQRRRWCSMSVCGNRAKAAAHRARKN